MCASGYSAHYPVEITSIYFLFPRFWDLAYPERSYIVAGSTSSPSVSYYRKIIEGTEVVQVLSFAFLSSYIGTKVTLVKTASSPFNLRNKFIYLGFSVTSYKDSTHKRVTQNEHEAFYKDKN